MQCSCFETTLGSALFEGARRRQKGSNTGELAHRRHAFRIWCGELARLERFNTHVDQRMTEVEKECRAKKGELGCLRRVTRDAVRLDLEGELIVPSLTSVCDGLRRFLAQRYLC